MPDGTTAHVRCPACRAVFPAAVAAVPPPPPVPPPRPAPRPAPPPPPPLPYTAEPEAEPPPPDDDPAPAKKWRPDDGRFTPAEKALLRGQFARGMWGARLVATGYFAQVAGLLLVTTLYRVLPVGFIPAELFVVVGLCGLIDILVVPVGVGLLLASRPTPGLARFGWAAVAAIFVHGVLVLAGLIRSDAIAVSDGLPRVGVTNALAHLMTKLDALTLYLTAAIYPNESPFNTPGVVLGLFTGLAEMVRLILVGVLLGAVARGAGHEEQGHRCVKAAGIGSLGPAGLAVATVLVMGFMIETGNRDTKGGMMLLHVFALGLYALLAGTLLPTAEAARGTAHACEHPILARNSDVL